MDPFRLDGRTALVTGASRGIGAAIARGLDAAGARVALAARSREGLEAVAGGLTNDPVVLETDLAGAGAPAALAAAAVAALGPYVVLHPGASVPARAWPVGHHAGLARLLADDGWDVVVTGGPGDTVPLPALLVVDGADVTSDAAALAGVTVSGEVVAHTKGPKIDILKYKNKTGYKRRLGHRQRLTQVRVTSIDTGK